jgi:hypothetical protein
MRSRSINAGVGKTYVERTLVRLSRTPGGLKSTLQPFGRHAQSLPIVYSPLAAKYCNG